MEGINLSTRERIMFDVFKKNPKDTSVDDLTVALKKAGEKFLGGTRSLTVSVRYLAYKIAPKGYYIERISDLGRGNRARYKMTKVRRAN